MAWLSFWKTEFRQYFGRGKTKVDWNDNNYSGHSADDDPDTSSDTNDHPVSNSDFGIGNGDHFSDSDGDNVADCDKDSGSLYR